MEFTLLSKRKIISSILKCIVVSPVALTAGKIWSFTSRIDESGNSSSDQKSSSNFLDVRSYGAIGNGIADDTHAIQKTIDAAGRAPGGGTIYFPSGQYLVTSSRRITSPNQKSTYDGMALVIKNSNVKLMGDGAGKSKIIHRAYGNKDFKNSWQIVQGVVWRGHTIMVTSGCTGVSFENLEITANTGNTGNAKFPANLETGDGWDVTHKCVYFEPDGRFDKTSFKGVHFHGFRGEIVFAAGSLIGEVRCENSVFNDTNGDCWSVQAACFLQSNHFYDAAGNCLDGVQGGFHGKTTTILGNVIENSGVAGIYSAVLTSDSNLGILIIKNNTIINAKVSGIALTSSQNTIVANNILVDCGWGSPNNRAVQVSTRNKITIKNLSIISNIIKYVTKMPSGQSLIVYDSDNTQIKNVNIHNNTVEIDKKRSNKIIYNDLFKSFAKYGDVRMGKNQINYR